MSGDFSRDSFDPHKHFTRVLMQQGRPQLDADWNEQIAIFWHYWRSFVADLIGPYAGPAQNCGFGLLAQSDFPLSADSGVSPEDQRRLQKQLKNHDFLVCPGHFYVNGILCRNHAHFPYAGHIGSSEESWSPDKSAAYLVYLDVWERSVSALEDDWIREPALNGIDTCLRTKVTWRVRAVKLSEVMGSNGNGYPDSSKLKEDWPAVVRNLQPVDRGQLKAMVGEHVEAGGTPSSGFRGPQNQLYRIEIHDDGTRGPDSRPTFKMSRENGSVEFRIRSVKESTLTLDGVGRDSRFGLKTGDWVEIVDPHGHVGACQPLRKVQTADAGRRQVTLDKPVGPYADDRLLILRRWDHKAGDRKSGVELRDGAAVIKEGTGEQAWLTLEDGLRIQFQSSPPGHRYRSGDYWLIPARVATGSVLWPHQGGSPEALPPHGIEHHYAPLSIIRLNDRGTLEICADCRPKFSMPVGY